MQFSGFNALFKTSVSVKAPVAALTAALLLSACVVPSGPQGSMQPVAQPEVVLPPQPAITIDDGLYAARTDGKFTIPAVPIDQVPETHRRQVVSYQTSEPAGTIIIDPSSKLLYYILGDGTALRYGISVGAEGFQWSGTAVVANKRQWPTWTPPKEMIARKPSLEKWRNGQPGGPTNPLGSRAIYLTTDGVDYGYRIHGTPEWKTIGRNASSGCFRMINQDVMDLYERVQGGEKVIVLTETGEVPTKLSIQSAPKPKVSAKRPAANPVVTPAAVSTPREAVGEAPSVSTVTSPVTSAPAAAAPASPAPVAPAPVTSKPGGSGSGSVKTAPAAAPVAVTPKKPAASAPSAPAEGTLLSPAPVIAPVQVVPMPVTPVPVAPVTPVTPAPVTPAPVVAPVTPAGLLLPVPPTAAPAAATPVMPQAPSVSIPSEVAPVTGFSVNPLPAAPATNTPPAAN